MPKTLKTLVLGGLLGAVLFSAGCQRHCALAGGVAAQCLANDRTAGTAAVGQNRGDPGAVPSATALVFAGGGRSL